MERVPIPSLRPPDMYFLATLTVPSCQGVGSSWCLEGASGRVGISEDKGRECVLSPTLPSTPAGTDGVVHTGPLVGTVQVTRGWRAPGIPPGVRTAPQSSPHCPHPCPVTQSAVSDVGKEEGTHGLWFSPPRLPIPAPLPWGLAPSLVTP